MVFVRKVVRRSKKAYRYSADFPREVMERLDLVGATIKFTIKNERLIITKITDESDDTPKSVKTSKPEEGTQHGSSDGLII